jgi:capsular polysaccharide biosynthesis protein
MLWEDVHLHLPSGSLVNTEGHLIAEANPQPGSVLYSRLLGKRHPVHQELPVEETGAAIIVGQASRNYYHWLIDCVPKMYRFREWLAAREIPVFAPRMKGAFGEALEALCPPEVTLETPAQTWVRLRHAYVLPPYSRPNEGLLPPGYRAFVQQRLQLPNSRPPCQNLRYLSRRQARRRRLRNEAAFIRRCIEPLGGEAILMEGLPFREQVQALWETSVVVSPHGAGLSNLLASPEDRCLLEIRSFVEEMPHYLALCRSLGQEYRCYTIAEPSAVYEDFWLTPKDMASIEYILQEMLPFSVSG